MIDLATATPLLSYTVAGTNTSCSNSAGQTVAAGHSLGVRVTFTTGTPSAHARRVSFRY